MCVIAVQKQTQNMYLTSPYIWHCQHSIGCSNVDSVISVAR